MDVLAHSGQMRSNSGFANPASPAGAFVNFCSGFWQVGPDLRILRHAQARSSLNPIEDWYCAGVGFALNGLIGIRTCPTLTPRGKMKLSLRSRKVFALLILCVALPVYIFVAVTIVGLFERPHMLVEFGIYAFAGILWALPFKSVFLGVGAKDAHQNAKGQD